MDNPSSPGKKRGYWQMKKEKNVEWILEHELRSNFYRIRKDVGHV